jgi:HEAT repeat protein
LIHDKRADVQIEALRTLGEIGGQAAVDALAEALLELDDEPRRVAAEALARCGRAGWDLIKEGATLSDDQGEDVVRVRRAAVFGLACIDQPWARDRLLTMQREDPQWAVRSSATDALRLIGLGDEESEEAALDVTPLDRDSLGWLVQWSAVKGQSIGRGQAAEQALQRALDDLEPNVRLAAVHTYAHLGDKASIPALVNKLKDENPQVRDAAYHALVEIARRRGEIVSL